MIDREQVLHVARLARLELSDEEIIKVLTKEAKKRREAAEAFANAGRQDRAEAELAEKAVLEEYLPAQLTDEERMAEGISILPGSLAEALDEMERSELVADALGEHVFEWFIRNKRAEWQEYKTQVSQFELDRYLPRL